MSKNIFINILLLMSLAGCIDLRLIEKWDDARAIRNYDRKEKAYYEKETSEQKRLRKINNVFCTQLAEKSENREKGGYWMDSVLKKCMKERGSPMF